MKNLQILSNKYGIMRSYSALSGIIGDNLDDILDDLMVRCTLPVMVCRCRGMFLTTIKAALQMEKTVISVAFRFDTYRRKFPL